jgi:hypothetical protein
MKMGKWTIIRKDKRIIKQYGDGKSIGYIVEDENFWNNNLAINIHAVQYTGSDLDTDQVEFNDGSENSKFLGNIKIFADEWDKVHTKYLQGIWDNKNLYKKIPNPNITQENPEPMLIIIQEETVEQKTLRLGPRPVDYISIDIY